MGVIGSSSDRLRGLRRVLTVLFTAMNALGLVVFAWLLIDADAADGRQRLDAELSRISSTVLRLIEADGRYEANDPLNDRCPQFAVVPVDPARFSQYTSKRRCMPVDEAMPRALAAEAVGKHTQLTGYGKALDGREIRVMAEPFRVRSGEYVGAVVAIADAEPESVRHNRMLLQVCGGCAVLIGGLGLAGHVLAGRAMRPATSALREQELMLGEVAHDLRAPVAKLRVLAETAQRHPDLRPELLPRAVKLAGEMGGIIDGSLLRARVAAGAEKPAFEPVWLDQLVEGMVEDTQADDTEVIVTTQAAKVDADPVLLRRALRNLLVNALRHARSVVRVSVLADGRVLVADDGPGVDPEITAKMFEPFASGGGSSGLGLGIVRWVALAHGGTLRVFNAEEGGAIFELALPLSDA
ncbi:sensor histidine kinase [Amycolatopsis sp. NPDC059657]|uniref:sensor histidine kinase n=1 Tax=Amycolatopsis sp. NPDC059657 TaxID=3346899 RepID=UPI00366C9D3D